MMNTIVDQILLHSLFWFFLVFGIVGILVGTGLAVNSAGMHGLFGKVNHWVSLRHSMKWLAIPRDTGITPNFIKALFGFIFVAAATFSTFILVMHVDVAGVATAFNLDLNHTYVVWIIESVRWLLIAGNLLVIPTGIMMIFFQDGLRTIESHTNNWYSFRNHTDGCDTMHMVFDRWIEKYPKATGVIITAGALLVVIQYGILLYTRS